MCREVVFRVKVVELLLIW